MSLLGSGDSIEENESQHNFRETNNLKGKITVRQKIT